MKELLVYEIGFEIIPDVEKERFLEQVVSWYEWHDQLVPETNASMLFYCEYTKEMFLDYVGEIQEYDYASQFLKEHFNPEQFPVNKDYWSDGDMEMANDDWIHHLDSYELGFAKDLKLVLDRNYMFYAHTFNETTFINQPITEVW